MAVNNNRASSVVSFLVTLIIVCSIFATWLAQLPAEDEHFYIGTAPFSLKNTQSHIATIAQQAHYTGAKPHAGVRDYITNQLRQLGLQVEIQSELATSSKYFVASKIHNIVAKLPNTASRADGLGLALMSHYDSANVSARGASDAGHGVAIIIEAIRTLIESGVSRQNDIYVIITDAEEQGLLGAEAFIRDHRWAKHIGLTLNFEARGSGGVSYTLLETNTGNKALIDAFSQADVNYPAANSLMYSIYKMLPNDTDLTVFREQGNIKGFNFAFIDDHFDYHTEQDTLERLDTNTLNHQIDYLTALLPHFANYDLTSLNSESDQVYFNLASLGMIDYPFSWVIPMAVLATLIFIILCVVGLKRGSLTLKHLFIGLLPAGLSVGIAIFVGVGGWALLTWLYPQFNDIPQGFTYNGHSIIVSGILLTLSLGAWLYRWMMARFSKVSSASWYVAVVLIWLLINLGIALYLTGAGFFILVSFASLAIFALVIFNRSHSNLSAICITLLSIPTLVLLTPQIPVFVIGLGLSSLYIATTLSMLVLMTLLPLLFVLKGVRSIQLFMLAGAVISLIGVVQTADYSADRKKPSSVNYVYDTQSDQAYLFSFNQRLDEFSLQFFEQVDRSNEALKGIYPITRWRYPHYVKAVPALTLQATSYLVKRSSTVDGKQKVTLTAIPNRDLTSLQISSDRPIQIDSMRINDEAFTAQQTQPRAGFVMRYVVTDREPVKIELVYSSDLPAQLRLIEASHDFPARWPKFIGRAEHIMPTPFRPSDLTFISQPILFE
ncbi:M20/M25/M40 family metallo-hydrolase [Aliiglaciecola litoralis]|uniref:Vacuolar membrane protease n=1 Tax=Aliiglaciecola litoralis TaxID=582857 RepID=A0ABN1LCV7_9ALTE